MGYNITSNSIADDYINSIDEAAKSGDIGPYNNFLNAMSNSQALISQIRPYSSSASLPSLGFDLNAMGSEPYAPYIQAKPGFIAEDAGYVMTSTTLRDNMKFDLVDSMNLVLISQPSIASYWNQCIQFTGPTEPNVPRLTSYIIPDNIPEDRLVAYVDGSGAPASAADGGGVATPELEYLVGGMWGVRSFDEDQFEIENAMRRGFLPAYRPPDFGGHIPASNNKANLHVIDINGVCYLSYSQFKVMQVDKIQQNNITRLSSLDGDKISFSCNKDDMIRVQGVLLDTPDSDQARLWEYNWNTYLNGYINAYNQCQTVLAFDNQWVVGYILSSKTNTSSQNPYLERLSFTMHVSDQKVMYVPPKRGHNVRSDE